VLYAQERCGVLGDLHNKRGKDAMSSFRKKYGDSCKSLTFWLLCLFVAVVAAYDTHRCVVDQAHLVNYELNPLARGLLHLADGQVNFLVGFKTLGTCLALGLLQYLWHLKFKGILVIVSVLALCQLAVLYSYCPLFAP
jgi:hypothetical protein